MKKITLLIVLIGLNFGIKAQNEIINGVLKVRSTSDGLVTFQTLDDSWLYTEWKNSLGVRKAYMGFNPDLTNFILGLENGANKFSIPNGNVGIGTTTPSSKLDIRNGHLYVGNGTFNNPGSWGQTINIEDNFHSRILIEENDTGVKTSLWAHTGGNAKVGTISNHDFGIMTNKSAKLTVKTNGNVGIGTTNPVENLQIESVDNAKIRLWTTSPSNKAGITFMGKRATTGNSSHYIGTEGTSSFNLAIESDEIINLKTNDVTRMRIGATGNIGIGTTNTFGYKLAVNGTIGAKKVKVEVSNPWPDYVFSNRYKLPTLSSVEKHIKEKGHLKGIPSAKEVEKNGIDLGEMNAKLLQKIEELTLYTIQQEKKIRSLERQKSKIKKLEKENTVLKSLLERVSKLEQDIKTKINEK